MIPKGNPFKKSLQPTWQDNCASMRARIAELEKLLKTSFDIEAPENAGYDTYEEWVEALKEYQRGAVVDYERRGKSSR